MRRRGRYAVARDPHWITARYPAGCRRCGAEIRRGERAFYYPSTRTLYCAAQACGGACHAEFAEAAALERDGGYPS